MVIHLDEQKSILNVKPDAALSADNFLQLTAVIDPYLAQHGTLKGLLIETARFPGWENVNAFLAHMRFIKNHQAKIQKIALVTDSQLANFVPQVIGPFVKPQIKHFPFGEEVAARQWID
jgi:hypothetical protein